MIEKEKERIYEDIENISEELRKYDEVDIETLGECVRRAEDGVHNVIDKSDTNACVMLGLSQMKGEWTIVQNRPKNKTEEHFAERFIYVLGKRLYQ